MRLSDLGWERGDETKEEVEGIIWPQGDLNYHVYSVP